MITEAEIQTVDKEVYRETRRAVEALGMFIVPIRPLSIEDLLEEDKKRVKRRLNDAWVHSSRSMRTLVPPEMEVFIDPNVVRIKRSNKSINVQKQMIEDAEASFRLRLPEAVRRFVIMRMADPSTLSQIEDSYIDKKLGVLLFSDFFARTDVLTDGSRFAEVGRLNHNNDRLIDGWNGDDGRGVFAVPVGVLPWLSS